MILGYMLWNMTRWQGFAYILSHIYISVLQMMLKKKFMNMVQTLLWEINLIQNVTNANDSKYNVAHEVSVSVYAKLTNQQTDECLKLTMTRPIFW